REEPVVVAVADGFEGQHGKYGPCGPDLGTRAGGDEAVADPWHGHDPVLACRRRAERLAQGRDLHRKVALLDGLAWPGGVEQSLLADHFTRACGKHAEELPSPMPQRHGCAVAHERSCRRIEVEGTELHGGSPEAAPTGPAASVDHPHPVV